MAYTPQSVYFSFFGFLRRFVSIVFSLSIVCLLILFGLQLNHRPSIDTLWLVVQLHGWGDPLLGLLAKRLGTAWPTVGTSYLPLGVVAGVWDCQNIHRWNAVKDEARPVGRETDVCEGRVTDKADGGG